MHLTRSLLLAGACWALVAPTVHAIGFGRPPANIALGVPLDFTVPLRLEAGESVEPECISAEVLIGERRIPAYNLRWAVEPGPGPNEHLVRVISLTAIDEPVVTVQVQVGCTAHVARRFTVFADPPPSGAAAPTVAARAAEGSAPVPPALARSPGAARPGAAAAPAHTGPRANTTATAAPRASNRARREAASPPRQARPRAVAGAPAARLALDAPDSQVLQRAIAAALADQQASAAQVAQAASAAEHAASAATHRLQALDQQVAKLLAETQSQREQMQLLRAQASRNGQASRWLPWLGAALAASLALAAWLGWRLRKLQRHRQDDWWADAAAVLADARPDPEPTSPGAATPSVALPPPVAGRLAPHAPPAADAAQPDLVIEPAAAPSTLGHAVSVEPGWTNTSPPPRPVSIEELIDLEQQAEFFVVLGQDESAIDLLVAHLRDTGGTSPLPYLKLLEIYRRRGDTEAYERTRTRFNQRFNAYAPEWDTEMLQGRTLEDYPQVMARLQRAWASPIDAMAELESLLFRKDGGELFELPAYREVLMLYSLARDLLDHQGAVVTDVDVLLPLGLPQPVAAARAQPLSVGETTIVITPDLALERPLQAQDLDLDLGPPPAGPRAA